MTADLYQPFILRHTSCVSTAVEVNPLRRDPLERSSSGRRCPIDHSYKSSPGEIVPVTVTPEEVNNSVPLEDENKDAVKKLRRNRSGGAVGDASRAPEKVACGVHARDTS